MTNAVCFRCDWEGTAEGACPKCGAPLYGGGATRHPGTGAGPDAGHRTRTAPSRSRPPATPRPARPAVHEEGPMTPTIEGEEEQGRRPPRAPALARPPGGARRPRRSC